MSSIFRKDHTKQQFTDLYNRGLTQAEPYWDFGYPKLTQVVPELQSGLWWIIAPENVGKCYTGDVLLADGSYKHISEVEPGDVVMTLGRNCLEPRRIVRKVHSGVKPTFRVTLYDGSEVVVTAEHPFLTRHGWRSLQTLQVGQEVGVPNALPCGQESRDPKQLRLLGYLLGDGGTGNGNVYFTNANPEILEDFQSCLPEGYELVPHSKTNPYTYRVRGRNGGDYGGPGVKGALRLWCEEVGLWGCRSWEKALPGWIYRLDEAGIVEVLRGLFATDAHMPNTREIEYCSTSRELAFGVKRLLLRLGVRARLTGRTHRRGRDSYRVYIGAKGSQIDRLWAKLRVPGKSVGEHPCVQWMTIVGIQPQGEQDVWDIEVEGTHNFIGGEDIFLHNSMWQLNLAYNVLQNNPDSYWLDFSLDDSVERRLGYLLARTGEIPISLIHRAGDASDEEKALRKAAFATFLKEYGERYHLEGISSHVKKDAEGNEITPITRYSAELITRLVQQARKQVGEKAKLLVTVDGFHDVELDAPYQDENDRQKKKSAEFKRSASRDNALYVMTAHCRKDSRSRNQTADIMKGDDSVIYDAMVTTHLFSDVNLNRDNATVYWQMEENPNLMMPVLELDILKNKAGGWKGVIFYNYNPARCHAFEVDELQQDVYRSFIFGKG